MKLLVSGSKGLFWVALGIVLFANISLAETSYLEVPKVYGDDQNQSIPLAYYWLTERVSSRPTVILIHGGPGLDASSINESRMAKNLVSSKLFNVLSFDQRGTGNSYSRLERQSPAVYTSLNTVHDIDALRTEIIQQEKVSLLGHSYGATLGYLYAATFPKALQNLVVASGSQDSLGFTTQIPGKVEYVMETLQRVFGDDKAPRYFQAFLEETLFSHHPPGHPQRHILGIDRLDTLAFAYSSGMEFGLIRYFKGVKKIYPTPASLPQARQRNQVVSLSQVESFLNRYFSDRKSPLNHNYLQYEVTPDDFIMCQNFMTASTINSGAAKGWDMYFARRYKFNLCGQRMNEYTLEDLPVDSTGALQNGDFKVLMVIGTEDHKPHPKIMQQEMENLNEARSFQIFVPGQHDTASGNVSCSYPIVERFFSDSVVPKITECEKK